MLRIVTQLRRTHHRPNRRPRLPPPTARTTAAATTAAARSRRAVGPGRDDTAATAAVPRAASAAGTAGVDRVRMAWQRRHDTDYIFDFWTALGWTMLTLRHLRLLRRVPTRAPRSAITTRAALELLDAATTFAWEQAQRAGHHRRAATRVRPHRAEHGGRCARQTTQFRDPAIWMILDVIASGIVHIVAVHACSTATSSTHDHAEGAIEAELSAIYAGSARRCHRPTRRA